LSTKLKCLLLDDELPGLTYLRMLCEQFPNVEVVKSFNDPLKFMEDAVNLEYDFCILDIEMPGMSGLEIANKICNKPVIFTTAYKDYAAEAFDLEAIDYIRKPITKERLEKAVGKAIQLIGKTREEKQFVQLNTNKGKALLFFDQVIYITTAENDKRDKEIFLQDGTQMLAKNVSFDQLLQQFPARQFCRINKKEVIALDAVRFFVHDEITLSVAGAGEKKFGLSENYRAEFLQKATR
jgi:DNA-binding LytR/AlgR family response regulator